MLKIRNFFLIIILLISCERNNIVVEDESAKISFTVFYNPQDKDANILLPDTGSIIYIYYNISLTDITAYDLKENGLFYPWDKKKSVIRPNLTDVVHSNGEYAFKPEGSMEKVMTMIKSNHYKEYKLKSFFSDNYLQYHKFEQKVKVIFDY